MRNSVLNIPTWCRKRKFRPRFTAATFNSPLIIFVNYRVLASNILVSTLVVDAMLLGGG